MPQIEQQPAGDVPAERETPKVDVQQEFVRILNRTLEAIERADQDLETFRERLTHVEVDLVGILELLGKAHKALDFQQASIGVLTGLVAKHLGVQIDPRSGGAGPN
jgi:hypothetical protein